jgi:hypothetical protein
MLKNGGAVCGRSDHQVSAAPTRQSAERLIGNPPPPKRTKTEYLNFPQHLQRSAEGTHSPQTRQTLSESLRGYFRKSFICPEYVHLRAGNRGFQPAVVQGCNQPDPPGPSALGKQTFLAYAWFPPICSKCNKAFKCMLVFLKYRQVQKSHHITKNKCYIILKRCLTCYETVV